MSNSKTIKHKRRLRESLVRLTESLQAEARKEADWDSVKTRTQGSNPRAAAYASARSERLKLRDQALQARQAAKEHGKRYKDSSLPVEDRISAQQKRIAASRRFDDLRKGTLDSKIKAAKAVASGEPSSIGKHALALHKLRMRNAP